MMVNPTQAKEPPVVVHRVVGRHSYHVIPPNAYAEYCYQFGETEPVKRLRGPFWCESIPAEIWKEDRKRKIAYYKNEEGTTLGVEERNKKMSDEREYAVYNDEDGEWEWPKALQEHQRVYEELQKFSAVYEEETIEKTFLEIKLEDLYVLSPTEFADSEFSLDGSLNAVFKFYPSRVAEDELKKVVKEKDIALFEFKGEYSKINGKYVNLGYPSATRVLYEQLAAKEKEIREEVRKKIIAMVTPLDSVPKKLVSGVLGELDAVKQALSNVSMSSKRNEENLRKALLSVKSISDDLKGVL